MATPGVRNDPYKGFRFRLEIQGLQVAGFSEATLPDQNIDSTTYREGTDIAFRKLSGLAHVGKLSLKRGVTDSMDLYNWFNDVRALGAAAGGRKSVSVVLIDEAAQEKVRWNMTNAWPSSYASSEFNASSSEAMIESLELELESITRVK
jgi:phage tail-like protein